MIHIALGNECYQIPSPLEMTQQKMSKKLVRNGPVLTGGTHTLVFEA